VLRTGRSATSGEGSYKQFKEVTSDVLNGVRTTKETKVEYESAVVCIQPPPVNGGISASPALPLPQMNFAGASNFHINFNFRSSWHGFCCCFFSECVCTG